MKVNQTGARHPAKRRSLLVPITIGVVVLGGVGGVWLLFQQLAPGRAAAQELVEQYFAATQKGDVQAALRLYSTERISRAACVQMHDFVQKKLGNLRSYRRAAGGGFYTAFGKGTYYAFYYDTTYDRFPAHEKITVFAPIAGEPLIVGHNIDPIGIRDYDGL